MHKTFVSVLAVLWLACWSVAPATANTLCNGVAGNLVTNCSFNTGDFTGWTISGNSNNPGSNYFGVDAFDSDNPNVGGLGGTDTGATHGAYLSEDAFDGGETPMNLSQTITTVVGDTYQIIFWLSQDTTPQNGYTHSEIVTFGGTPLLSLTNMNTGTGYTSASCNSLANPISGECEYEYTYLATGTSATLQFATINDDNYYSLDDVSVVNETSAAEPAAPLLLGMVLAGFGLAKFWKRSI